MMKTYEECIPCFLRQINEVAELVSADPVIRKEIIAESMILMNDWDRQSPPPRMAQNIYRIIERKMGRQDPYLEIKQRSNAMALSLYPALKRKVEASSDRLLTALEIASSGNIIDYGAKNNLDIDREIDKIFTAGTIHHRPGIFDDICFKNDLLKCEHILYLADNAGEVVFDKILIEELMSKVRVTYVVREKPIINDALMEDALVCGINQVATVISSGSDAPGTILSDCFPDFVKLFNQSFLVISKGQGNYETLSHFDRPLIYFLFKAKCPVVADHAQAKVGDIVLKRNQ
jgi:damage-control phosphatase, subfamily I